MENFLIVIIFIGSIIYKIYSNYKEEIKKAKKRIPNQRPIPMPQTYMETVLEKDPKTMIPNTVTSNKKDNSYINRNYDNRADEIPEEVRRAMVSQKQKHTITSEKQTVEEEAFEFNFRQAVIQAAILDRPYK